jgi:hypothetical protein
VAASSAQIARHKRLVARYRLRLSAALVAAWDRLDAYDEADVERYERMTRPAVTGAKAVSVASSAAFFALATSTRPSGIRVVDVDTEPRLGDPFYAAWHAVKQDRPWEEALSAGRSMASAVGFNFVQSTVRRTGDLAADKAGWSGRWRRVPGGTSCSWCLLVAGQTYRSAESADFGHDRCDCDAVPA